MCHISRALWLEKHCLQALSTLEQCRRHGGSFCLLLAEYGERVMLKSNEKL